ncbi:MAG: tetratricopeptide repeat protein [Pseudomonadales bacterium]
MSLNALIPRLLRMQTMALLIASLLVGCAGLNKSVSDVDRQDTLGALPAAYIPPQQKVDDASLDIVAAGYKDALALISDQIMQDDILRRLAMIELRYAEGKQAKATSSTKEAVYANAIATYNALIETQQYRKDNDKLLYPLAKAYELSGDMPAALRTFDRLVNEFPESTYYSEAQFRRGEILFSNAEYKYASNAYHAIVLRNIRDESLPGHQPSSFLVNAYYMWGWTEFKLERHDEALRAFVVVLDEYTQKAVAGYATRSSDELLQDTFRVMALSFSYTDGADSIAALLDEINERPYANRLFAELGDLYLRKKRFRDSAAVFDRFVQRYPDSPLAPRFHQRQIDAFTAGRFPEEVREQKRRFAQNYAVEGDYWSGSDGETQQFIRSKLLVYIDELARYHHSLAQKAKRDRAQGVVDAPAQLQVTRHFRDAAGWYREWIRSFPGATDLPEKYFLLGETEFEASDFGAAVAAYEMAAYGFVDIMRGTAVEESIADFGACAPSLPPAAEQPLVDTPAPPHAESVGGEPCEPKQPFDKYNEAGYAALLAYDELIARSPEPPPADAVDVAQQNAVQDTEQIGQKIDTSVAAVDAAPIRQQWQLKKIESALLFAEHFPADPRRSPVLSQTASSLLALGQHERTIEVAALLTSSDSVKPALLFNGWVSAAHAQTALLRYPEAEAAYREALLALESSGAGELYQQHFQATLDNYAASIYRQGEAMLAAGDGPAAAETFLRVVEAAPTSAIRVTAQHDASVLLMQAEQWQRAVAVISDFQQRFPDHGESRNASARLLKANEAMENWAAAAVQALAIADADGEPQLRRDALYRAAELFEKDGDEARTLDTYLRYAHTYQEPLADLMEAQYKLVGIYKKRGDHGNSRAWLSELISANQRAANSTDRSRYLAAYASSELANDSFDVYSSIKLSHPIKDSLASKRESMQQTIAAYERAAKYGVEKFTTLATQRMGEVYASFARDLMESERPRNLSELELEQYDFLLEEQAYPFEEQAIAYFRVNVERAWKGMRTDSIKDTYKALARLLPAKYGKTEMRPGR